MRKTIDMTIQGREVILSRRKGTRHLRLSVKSDGSILLTVPHIVSEKRAIQFLESKIEWIESHLKPQIQFEDNSLIGKGGRVKVVYESVTEPSVRLSDHDVVVKVADEDALQSSQTQIKIAHTAEKSIKKQAEHLLPQRLEQLAKKFNVIYKSASVRKLKSRWGSCDTHNNITLNMYLIQLDWSLIDYVIIHELAHTSHKHHQADFWAKVESMLPNYKELRKTLKTHQTAPKAL